MALLPFAGVCLATFLVLQFWWIRRLRQAVRAETTAQVLVRAAKLALLRYVRAVALVGLVTSLSVASVMILLRSESPPHAKATAVHAAMSRVQDAKRSLDALHPYWFATAGLLVTIGLGVYTYRRRHIQCSAAFQAAGEAEFDRLFASMNNDPSWWDLPPNHDMAHIRAECDRLEQMLPDLPEHVKPAVEQQIEQLRRVFMQVDIARRMAVRLDPDAVEDPEPETWREWLACLIGGRRLLGSVGLGTRSLYRANLVLLMLGLIGFSTSGVYQVLDDRLVGLQDLQVRIQWLEGLEAQIAMVEQKTELQTVQSSSTDHRPLRVGDFGLRAAEVQARLVQAKASRASLQPVDEKIHYVQAEVKAATVLDQQHRDLIAEIRKATDEAPDAHGETGPRGTGERERIATLRDRLARESADLDGPSGRLSGRADALKRQLAELDPDAQLAPLREKLTGLEKQHAELRVAREKADKALADEMDRIGPLRGREAEQAALRRRIAGLRSEARRRLADAAEPVKRVKAEYEAELSARRAEFSPRREQVRAVGGQVDALAEPSARRPAELHAGRLRLEAAEARLDWEANRATERAPVQELSVEEKAYARRIARAYEITEGQSLAKGAVIPEPDPKVAAEMRGLATRDAILKRAQAVAPSDRVRPPTLTEAPALSQAEKGIARSAEAIFKAEAPRTWVGKAMEETLVAEARTSPSLRRVLADAARSAERSIRAIPGRRFWGELALETLDVAARPIDGGLVAQVSRDTYAQYEKAARYRFVRDLAGDRGIEAALARIRGVDAPTSLGGTARDYIRQVHGKAPSLSSVAKTLRPYEPAIDVPFEAGVKLDRASALIRQETARAKPELRAYRAGAMSEALYNYSDPFPSQLGMDRLTPRGQILESFGGARGPGRALDPERLAEWSASGKLPTRPAIRPAGVPSLAREGLIGLGPRPAPSALLESKASGARLFRNWISSPKIGGVLIGREPTAAPAGQALELTDLRWQIEADNARLIVSDRDGRVHRSRPFRRDLVELALVYAADGRPITVTIINASPLHERRVLLHPALVDTALGRSVIRADMIIFEVISEEPWYREAYQSVRNQIELYRRAWAIRQLAMGDLKLLKPEYVETLKELVDHGQAGPLAAAIREADSLRSARRSLLPAKPEYFDGELVTWIADAAGPGRSLERFDAEIRRRADHELDETSRWLKAQEAEARSMKDLGDNFIRRAQSPDGFSSEAAFQFERQRLAQQIERYEAREKAESERLDRLGRRWTAPVPEIAHVSGIRERDFEPTLANCFVSDRAPVPPVVDFLIQITFESLPYFLRNLPPDPEDKAGYEALSSYNDPAPWEFPEIGGRVRELVSKSLDERPERVEDRKAVVMLSEFGMLQRLFRLALGGHLGRDFPIETLAELHREVAPATPVAPVRTLRWDSRPGQLEQALRELIDLGLSAPEGKEDPQATKLREARSAIGALNAEYEARSAEREKRLTSIEASRGPQGDWDAAWEEFQSWDRDWEARLQKAADALAASSRGTGQAVEAKATLDKVPEGLAGDLTEGVRQIACAIAVRRALDVAKDDRQTRLEQGRSRATGSAPIDRAGH